MVSGEFSAKFCKKFTACFFIFLFVAPWLYVFHAFLDGVSFYIADILNISIGNTFSGGFIDFLLFGILQGNAENIENVDACITRLRVAVKDVKLVNKARLKALGAIDVLEVGGGIQAVYGAKAVLYKSEVNQILGRED